MEFYTQGVSITLPASTTLQKSTHTCKQGGTGVPMAPQQSTWFTVVDSERQMLPQPSLQSPHLQPFAAGPSSRPDGGCLPPMAPPPPPPAYVGVPGAAAGPGQAQQALSALSAGAMPAASSSNDHHQQVPHRPKRKSRRAPKRAGPGRDYWKEQQRVMELTRGRVQVKFLTPVIVNGSGPFDAGGRLVKPEAEGKKLRGEAAEFVSGVGFGRVDSKLSVIEKEEKEDEEEDEVVERIELVAWLPRAKVAVRTAPAPAPASTDGPVPEVCLKEMQEAFRQLLDARVGGEEARDDFCVRYGVHGGGQAEEAVSPAEHNAPWLDGVAYMTPEQPAYCAENCFVVTDCFMPERPQITQVRRRAYSMSAAASETAVLSRTGQGFVYSRVSWVKGLVIHSWVSRII
ncbi:hypothetical protein LTR85_003697 [Meristemomyces frigidus]|nr:hypothetical protein LTR85_003697 [Meristemomyces frigidus]